MTFWRRQCFPVLLMVDGNAVFLRHNVTFAVADTSVNQKAVFSAIMLVGCTRSVPCGYTDCALYKALVGTVYHDLEPSRRLVRAPHRIRECHPFGTSGYHLEIRQTADPFPFSHRVGRYPREALGVTCGLIFKLSHDAPTQAVTNHTHRPPTTTRLVLS